MKKLAEETVQQLSKNGVISKDDEEIYIYGLKQGAFMILNLVTSIVIGTVMGMFWECIIFSICYLPLRSNAGGYHAKTALRCYLGSILFIAISLWGIMYFPKNGLIEMAMLFIGCVIIWNLAPVEDSNKPLDPKEQQVYKKRTRVILYILAFLYLLFAWTFRNGSYAVVVGITMESAMVLIGNFKNTRKRRYDEIIS